MSHPRTILTLALSLFIYAALATAYALDTPNPPVSPPTSNPSTSTSFIPTIDAKWYLGALFVLALYAGEGGMEGMMKE
ncbi:hypothetical protein GRF29_69g221112 [Pseudopithomyces chartarum]|uniref:Uncharacterized protein n=1 Tax=Pseudopithomyces chartarum TaxID=1892770 RepID=A0AAN6M0E8_9PLEO|nr:hypothetical protein GRF29_69g221112 [Pseudopithomyces chartarum]